MSPQEITAKRNKLETEISKYKQLINDCYSELVELQESCPHINEASAKLGIRIEHNCSDCGAEWTTWIGLDKP